MPQVLITNKGAHNYSDAERFGKLVFCTEGSIDRMDTQQMYRALLPTILDSEPCDYIVVNSLASLLAVAVGMFVERHGCLNLLMFSNGVYVAKTLHFDFNEGYNK